MYEIETYRITEINKSNAERDMTIAQIENNKEIALEEIQSKERMQIAELKANYDLKRREQKNEFCKFKKTLKEEARRFDKQYKIALNEQSTRHKFVEELRSTCKLINEKIIQGRATEQDINYCKHLMELQIMAFKENFSFTQAICEIFAKESSN